MTNVLSCWNLILIVLAHVSPRTRANELPSLSPHVNSYANARKVLNEARKKLPTEPSIWITAAKLEEANGNEAGIEMIVKRAVRALAQHNVVMEREQWLAEVNRDIDVSFC